MKGTTLHGSPLASGATSTSAVTPESTPPASHRPIAERLSWALLAVMVIQAALGLALHSMYRDIAWIDATWWGNDLVTLAIAAPTLLLSMFAAKRGSVRGRLIWTGALAYAAYNYAYYMLGASLNQAFILYIAAFVLAVGALIAALAPRSFGRFVRSLSVARWRRTVGGYLVFVAVGLSAVWLGTWASYAFDGRPTPVEVDAFRLVAALDMTLMVPVLALAGWLLIRNRTWGIAIGAVTAVQSSLYLLVLSVNSVIAIKMGLVEAPGELVIWLPLCLATTVAACALISGVRQNSTEG